MAPIQTMLISGTITAVAAVITMVSGATFKRAFDQYHQINLKPAVQQIGGNEKAVSPTHSQARRPGSHAKHSTNSVAIGSVKSEGQKGGVTAGYVENVKQD